MKINANQWKSIENQWKSLKINTFGTLFGALSGGKSALVIMQMLFWGGIGRVQPNVQPNVQRDVPSIDLYVGGGTPLVPLGPPLFSTDVQSTVDTEDWRLKNKEQGTLNKTEDWTILNTEHWTRLINWLEWTILITEAEDRRPKNTRFHTPKGSADLNLYIHAL